MENQDLVVGIITLFVLYTVAMCVFMLAAYETYMKVTGWFTTKLIADGKKNGWDMKRVVLPLLARNLPAIIILGLMAQLDMMTVVICYIVSLVILNSLEAVMGKNKKAPEVTKG